MPREKPEELEPVTTRIYARDAEELRQRADREATSFGYLLRVALRRGLADTQRKIVQ